MSKVKLQQLLTSRLGLAHPVFRLERIGAKHSGSIISETFRGKTAKQRQTMVWDALESELGADAAKEVGIFLLYTPEEWNIDLPQARKKKAG
jgi:acid stress-induced BolA-like protein IbaG/YrbA